MSVDPWRVAQIAVDRGPGIEGSRGSGYLIGPGRVLTAAHVLAGASVVRVRLDVGQETEIDVRAESWWADPAAQEGTDLAVITIALTATAGRKCESVRFGRISDCTATLTVRAFGFPLFKLRDAPAMVGQGVVLREFEQANGHAPVAANRITGTLEVNLDAPPPSEPAKGEPSPWQGMSGGPVWSDDRIVAVVAEHHPSEGTGRLTARRIDRAYEKLPASGLGELIELLGLPSVARGLPDVVPVEQAQRVQLAYLAQVRDIAPDELVGRDDELAQWAEFCAGSKPYAWWQAGPWAGKSALASWFVLHPPAGIDIVSFFITGRFLGEADSDAFLNAMIEQLNSLYPASGKSPPTAGARVGAWWELVASTAAEAEEQGRRLVVVVDGLDEDTAGAAPATGRPSIASLLPRRPSAGVRFIVTSRADPGLPDDVPASHPLRTCKPHRLTASRVAEGIALSAKQELAKLLAGNQIAIDVVGYVAGSGGGLTRSDLSALTGAPPLKLDPILRGVFGRSLQTRASSSDSRNPQTDPATRVYLFAHETLRITAEEQLGSDLVRYRDKVHEWIGSHAAAGWPDNAPAYAIRGYQRLLVATDDLTRLYDLARDPRRHAFLSEATGSDYAALEEIGTAQRLIANQKDCDLKALVELAAHRLAISLRNESIPDELPVTWARLARFSHAEALAHSLSSNKSQAQALTKMATVAAEAGDLDRAKRLAAEAEAIARTLTSHQEVAETLTGLVTAAADAGDLDNASRIATGAETITRTLADPYPRAQVLSGLITAIAKAGDPDRAEDLARALTQRHTQVETLSRLANVAAETGDLDRASRLATDAEPLTGPFIQDSVLTGLVTAIAKTGDLDRAEDLARAHPYAQAEAFTSLATVAAETGDQARASRLATEAETIARTLTDPKTQAQVLTALATIVFATGDLSGANRLTVDAETVARTLSYPYPQARVLTVLATAIAKTGELDRAEGLARTIADRYIQADALTGLATIAAGTGDLDRATRLATAAETLARTFTSQEDQAELLSGVAAAAADAGDLDNASRLATDAEAVARTLTDPNIQAQVLSQLAAVAAAADPDRTSRLATDAETVARTLANSRDRGDVITVLISALAKAGDPDRAETLARTLTDHAVQAGALASLATIAADTGDLNRANRLAADTETLTGTLHNDYSQARVLASLATAIAKVGDPDRAEALARTLTDPDVQAEALASLATVAAEAGDLNRANRLAADALTLTRTLADSYLKDRTLATLVIAIAKAGDPDRAEDLRCTIRDPRSQARALSGLASVIARTGDLDRAKHLLALALITDVDTGDWVRGVGQFFPSAIGDLWNILVGAYATGT